MDAHARRLLLTAGFLMLLTAGWMAWRGAREPQSLPPSIEGLVDSDASAPEPGERSASFPGRRYEGDLERAPGGGAVLPDPPGAEADAAELWRYGERFLGWTPTEDVDLAQYEPELLREWIRKDRSFHQLGVPLDGLALGYEE